MTHDEVTVAKALAPSFAGTEESLIAAAIKNYKQADTWVSHPAMKQESFNRLQEIMKNAGELDQTASYNDIVNNTLANKIG